MNEQKINLGPTLKPALIIFEMQLNPTPYADINEVLNFFLREIKNILCDNFVGMYVYGSLATGGFDPTISDIDFIVITHNDITNNAFSLLLHLHNTFLSSNSCWARKVEAAYIAQDALGKYEVDTLYPQIEKGKELTKEKLEMGWALQCYTLREHGIVVDGPEPHTLYSLVKHDDMMKSARSIVTLWHQQAHDEKEVAWLKQRDEQSFVVLTLCRFLHLFNTKTIASKLASGRWAQQHLDNKWNTLIAHAMNKTNQEQVVSDSVVKLTIEFIDHLASSIT